MPIFNYRLLNVFAESTFGGNPLCVFEDARRLSDQQMQALAMQFNLSETTFILPSTVASARMRIFTPSFEMPFAGHPSLGTAFVVRDLMKLADAVTLECVAGIVPVRIDNNLYTFTAPTSGGVAVTPCSKIRSELASLLSLDESDIASDAQWVNTGSDQLLVQLNSVDAVYRTRPNSARLSEWPLSTQGRTNVYVFFLDVPNENGERIPVVSRYFWAKQGNFFEDPGTGSACANLGGWWIHRGGALPAGFDVVQGERTGRLNRLLLDVSKSLQITVGGRVVELGRGNVFLENTIEHRDVS